MSDLIDRREAIDAFEDTTFTKNEIRRILTDVPSAQPERKKGKWIFEECKGNTYFRCSECGEIVTSAFMGFPRYEYCPMCGADMRGEE